QIRVLPVSERFLGYARTVHERLVAVGLRATLDTSDERVNAKIRAGADLRIPYLVVVGGRDEEAGTVSVRKRGIGDLGAQPLEEFVASVEVEVRERRAFESGTADAD
ncbi:MAG: threonine--tRNA ligase, partial [Planctomycetes bacterium]|nr:threonine--tRNA ligase [Planctomycetota bacterium]